MGDEEVEVEEEESEDVFNEEQDSGATITGSASSNVKPFKTAGKSEGQHHGHADDQESDFEKHINGLHMPEPVHIDDTKTMLLVARGGMCGRGNKVVMRSRGGGSTQQKLQSMVSTVCNMKRTELF